MRSAAWARFLLAGASLCLLPVAVVTIASQGSFHECTDLQSTATTPNPFDPPVGPAIVLAILAPLMTYAGLVLLSTPRTRRRALYLLGLLGLLILPLFLGLAAGSVFFAVRFFRRGRNRLAIGFGAAAVALLIVGVLTILTPLAIVTATPLMAWSEGAPLLAIPAALVVMAANLVRRRAPDWPLSAIAVVSTAGSVVFGFVLLGDALRVFASCILD